MKSAEVKETPAGSGLKTYELYIHGQWVSPSSGEYLPVTDPSTGQVIAAAARGQAEDVERAVQSSREGYQAWQRMGGIERGRVLYRTAEILRSRKEDLAQRESLDTGCSLDFASYTVTEIAARRFEFYAGLADKISGRTIPMPGPHFDYTLREALGVTLHITPCNSPLWTGTRSIAPALAAGNSVIVKPSEETLLNLLELAEIASQAGLPSGAFNVVTGLGAEAGSLLASHPQIDGITFTGSVETGRKIMEQASQGLKPLVLELGGKSPNIVFEDADIEAAAPAAVQGIFAGAGQVCVAGSRLLVQKEIKEPLLNAVLEKTQQLRVGPGNASPDMGPLISEKQLKRVLEYVSLGRSEGAQLIAGGHRLQGANLDKGFFMAPTIFDAVDNRMRIAREEIFGPVLCVIEFETEEEAIEIANDSSLGLAAAVWTQNLARAHRVASRLQAGSIYVNRYFSAGIEGPAGGYGLSGFGRLDGVEALDEYTRIKNVTVHLA